MTKEQFLLGAIQAFSSNFDISAAIGQLIRFINTRMPTELLILSVSVPNLKGHKYLAYATQDKAEWLDIFVPQSDKQLKAVMDKNVSHAYTFEYTSDQIADEIKRKSGLEEGNWSSLVLPLSTESDNIGFLVFTSSGKTMYTQEHIDLIFPLQDAFTMVLANALKHQKILQLQEMLTDDNRYLRKELHSLSGDLVIGKDGGLKNVMEMVRQVAPLASPVLLFGETGTGKEVIANTIHSLSPRKNGPFIKVNCGAIPETLIDSELFGHEKGAFTGAMERKRGRFERANGGTIFLDEIGELSLQAQVKLLRVLQQKEFERVGGTQVFPLDIRIITATHRNLATMIEENTFREDLFFRLNVFPITIPPLRLRRNDIPLLVEHSIKKKAREMKLGKQMHLAEGSFDLLMRYDWKGNVRELENVIERAIIRSRDGILRFDDLANDSKTQVPPSKGEEDLFLSLREINRNHIERALQLTDYKISGAGGAAQLLGLKNSTLRAKMKKLGIRFQKDL